MNAKTWFGINFAKCFTYVEDTRGLPSNDPPVDQSWDHPGEAPEA
jgi:hypothetical protein